MEKNNLKKIFPEIEAGRSIKTLAERTEGEAVIIDAIKKGGILALSVFFNDDLRKGETLPRIITFFEKTPNWDFISRKRAEDSQTYKWSSASLDNMPEDPLYQAVIMANKKTEKLLNSFFSKKMLDNSSSTKRIKSFQRKVKERKLIEKKEQKRRKILEEMNLNIDPPKPFFDWVEDISEKYFFFTKEKKEISYYTTCCEKKGTARMEEISFKHNGLGLCPLCGKKVKFVSSKKSCYKYQQLNACFIQKDGQRTIFRYFSYFHHSNSDGYNKKYIEECLRTIITDDNVVRYEKIVGEWKHSPRNGERISWTTIIPKSGLELYGCAYIYPGNLPEEIKGGKFENSGIDYYSKFYGKEIDLEIYLTYFINHQDTAEKIMKSGLYRLASTLPDYEPADPEGKNICEILGLNKEDFHTARKYEFEKAQIKILQTLRNMNVNAAPEDIIMYSKVKHHLSFVKEPLEYIYENGGSIKKLLNYLRKEEIRLYGEKTKPLADRQGSIFHKYMDYIRMAEKIGLNLNDPYYLFPKNINMAHDRAVDRYNAEREIIARKKKEEEEKRIEEKMKNLSFAMEDSIEDLQTEDLMLRIPKSAKDLYDEGDFLHHCVGTYKDKVASGKSIIFFIRKKDAPDTPYVTMEWADKILQVRGFRNCDPDADTSDFAKIIDKTLKKKHLTTKDLFESNKIIPADDEAG